MRGCPSCETVAYRGEGAGRRDRQKMGRLCPHEPLILPQVQVIA